MRYSAEHKRQTREAILDAAGRVFRSGGYGGAGIDGLTKAAGVTNGAFYGHFKTKADAFQTVVALGLEGLVERITAFQAEHGADWLEKFVDFYLGLKVTCDVGDACSLPMLSTEVARAEGPVRDTYEAQFRRLVAAVTAGVGGREDRAIAVLAVLSGAATFARAIPDPALRTQVVAAAREGVMTLAGA